MEILTDSRGMKYRGLTERDLQNATDADFLRWEEEEEQWEREAGIPTSPKTGLYRFFDARGQLLYVGISVRVANRLMEHRLGSRWFERVRSMTVEWYRTRSGALDAEAEAIHDERPQFNVAHR